MEVLIRVMLRCIVLSSPVPACDPTHDITMAKRWNRLQLRPQGSCRLRVRCALRAVYKSHQRRAVAWRAVSTGGPLVEVNLPRRRRTSTAATAESARGISPRAAHRSGLDTLASSGSCHRVKAAAFRCMSGSSRCRLTRPNVGDPLPSLHGHYTRFITTTEQSAPLRRIGTFGLAVVAACAFSLGIAGQVLTFRTRAWLSFAPSTCRMPLGPYQDIPRADPAGRVTPRF